MHSFVKSVIPNRRPLFLLIIFSSIVFSIAAIAISASSIRLIDELGCCETGDHYYETPYEEGFVYYKVKYEDSTSTICWCDDEPPEFPFSFPTFNSFTIHVYDSAGAEVSRFDQVFFCYTRSMYLDCGGNAWFNVKVWVKNYLPDPLIGYISIGYVCIWGFSLFWILRSRLAERKKEL